MVFKLWAHGTQSADYGYPSLEKMSRIITPSFVITLLGPKGFIKGRLVRHWRTNRPFIKP